MSDMRRLIESMDKISEAGPKGLQRPGLEFGPEMGGGGGAGGGGGRSPFSGSGSGTPPAVWRNRAGQTSATPPGTTVSQPLPPGVAPSTAGAGRGTTPVTQPATSGKDADTAKERLAAFDKLAKEISTGSGTKTVKKDTDPVGSFRPGGTDELGRREPGTGKINPPTPADSKKPEDAKKSGVATAVDRVMKPVGVAMDVATAGVVGTAAYLAQQPDSPTVPGSEPAPAVSTAPSVKKPAAAAPAANSTGTPAGAAADDENAEIERNLKQMGVKETTLADLQKLANVPVTRTPKTGGQIKPKFNMDEEKIVPGTKFPGYWKGRDSADKSRDRMVGDESIIPSLAKQAKEKTLEWQIEEAYKKFKEQDAEVKVGNKIIQNNPTTTELPPLAPAAAPSATAVVSNPVQPAVAPFGSGPPDTSLLKNPPQGSSSSVAALTPPAAAPVKPATVAPVPYKGSASAQQIQKVNPAIKDVNKIQAGQRLKLPNSDEDYVVQKGDTLDKIGKMYRNMEIGGRLGPKVYGDGPALAPATPATKPTAPATAAPAAPAAKTPAQPNKLGPTPRTSYDRLTPQQKQAVDAINKSGTQKNEAINKLAEQFAAFMEVQDQYGPEYQAMVKRVGDRARQGPMKTVWDPVKRVYKNVPVKQTKPVKEYENAQDQDSQVTSPPAPAATAASQTFVQDKELQNMNAQKTLEADAGAQDPNKQTTSPPSPAAVAKPVAPAASDVSVATAKTTMAGLKPALGPGVDTNAAATGVTKANLGQQLNPAEQQAVSAITPLVMKAATIPSAAPQLRSALTNAGTMARAAAAQQGKM